MLRGLVILDNAVGNCSAVFNESGIQLTIWNATEEGDRVILAGEVCNARGRGVKPIDNRISAYKPCVVLGAQGEGAA